MPSSCRTLCWLVVVHLAFPAISAPQSTSDKVLPSLDPNKRISQYVLDIWGDEEGLPYGNIIDIAQTPDGYLWLVTDGGLLRFDGVRFTVYNFENTPVFKSNILRELLVSSDGSLWIAAMEGGLIRFKDGQFSAWTSTEGLASNDVASLCEDRDGTIWFHAAGGLHQWQENKIASFPDPTGITQIHSKAIMPDQAGNFLLAGFAGLLRFSRDASQKFVQIDTLLKGRILSLTHDRFGNIWVGTHDDGLWRYRDGQFEHFTTASGLAHFRIWDTYEDRAGTLWLATANGLSRKRLGEEFDSYNALPDVRLRTIFEDREGNLWVGSYTRLYRFKNGQITTWDSSTGVSPLGANCIYQDRNGVMWIGTPEGLSRMTNGIIANYTTADGLPSNEVYSVAQDDAGTIWAGTSAGLARYEDGKFLKIPQPRLAGIQTLYKDRRGLLWIGTGYGEIFTYDSGTFTTWRPDLNNGAAVFWFHHDRADNFWIGRGGKLLQGPREGIINSVAHENLTSISTKCCHEEQDGTLWLGTAGNGLYRFQNGVFKAYTTRDGLFDNYVWSILEDGNGYLWMSSDQGIWRIHKQDFSDYDAARINKLVCTAYGKSEGLKTKEGNSWGFPKAWKNSAGELWFPMVQGVATVNPEQQVVNTLPPPVHLEEIWVDTVKFEWRRNNVIPAGKKNLTFRYTAASLRSPEKVRFKYKLEGYDAGWIDAGARRIAYYTNLAPNHYRIRVIACNENNVWNEIGASAAFSLAPRFYQTRWFAALCVFMLGFTIYQGYRWRLRYLQVRQVRLEKLIAKRTKQLRLSDARNKAILQALPDAIFRLGPAGKFLEYFPGHSTEPLVPPQEFLGKTVDEVLPAPLARRIKHFIAAAQHTKQIQTFEYELAVAQKTRQFEAYIVAFEKNETLAIVRDITARKQAEKTMREFEYFRLIAEASPIALAMTRIRDGVILFANHHIEQILGVSNRELISRCALDFYDNPAERAALLEEIQNTGAVHNRELKLRKPDGAVLWIMLSCEKLIFDGEPSLLIGYYDITTRKQAEEQQARYARTQAALVQANKVLLSTLDIDCLLTGILQAAQAAIPAAEKGAILLWDEEKQALQLKNAWGYDDPRVAQIVFSRDKGYSSRAARLRQPLIVPDTNAEEEIRYEGDIAEIRALRSAIVAPMILRGEMLGVISLDATTREAFQEDDLELLVAFASQAVLALGNARLHQQVRTSEERYRVLHDDNPSMYFTLDAGGAVLSVNRFGAGQLGYTAAELLGQSVLKIFLPEDHATVLRQLQLCLQTPSQAHYWELRKIRKDGSILWVGETARAVPHRESAWVVLIVCEDITPRKQAEHEIRRLNEELEQRVIARTLALQESETKFRTLAEMATAGIFIYQDGRLRYVNPATQQITGYTQAELMVRDPWGLLPPERQPEARTRGLALERGEAVPTHYELQMITKHGAERWIDFTARLIEFESRPAILGTALDITARKNLEAQLQKYTEDLEGLIAQRTARIQELERQRAEQEKLAVSGRMAARIAHEINNPLGIIQNAAKLVGRAVPQDHRHFAYVGLIEKEIARIARIVRQMLDLHRPQRQSPKIFRPSQTIADVMALLQPRGEEFNIRLEHDLQRAHATVNLPEDILWQILYNVIVNAIEASAAGGRVHVSAAVAPEHLRVEVTDQGQGIPEDIKTRIFEPFFTTKSTSTTGGIGLGLAICKSLLDALNGEIGFQSNGNNETICTIVIPLAQPPDNESLS